MSNSSKAKAIADLLMSDAGKWWEWDEILEGLIPGFSNVPSRIQAEIYEAYATYMPHARAELDDRGCFLMRDGREQGARFKIGTNSPEDKPFIMRTLVDQKKRAISINGRVEKRIENLKEEKILPKHFDTDKNLLNA